MGKYKYSQRIGRGGMADVLLAMQEGIGGFEKMVVVKRIFPHYSEDEHFVQMFLDEARLAATIRHHNVVEILDIDRDTSGYFIVMEYVSGETLGFIIPALQKRQIAVPPEIAARIGASVAAGLHEAHTATDAAGAPQPIVHRDVTPSNILVGYKGTVKLLDFGVAKAMAADGDTRVKGVKGKLSYLAPEQIHSKPVDARTDIFQLGIVLHEFLTCQGLFHAKSAHERLLAVLERPIAPPSQFNPEIPAALDDVVMRCLEREPDKRFQSADDMRSALEDVLHATQHATGERELGQWLRDTFTEAYEKRVALERQSAAEMRQSNQVLVPVTSTAAALSGPRRGESVSWAGQVESGTWSAGSQPAGSSWHPDFESALVPSGISHERAMSTDPGSAPRHVTGLGYRPLDPGSSPAPPPPPGPGHIHARQRRPSVQMMAPPSPAEGMGSEPSAITTTAGNTVNPTEEEGGRRRGWLTALVLLVLVAGGTFAAAKFTSIGGDGMTQAGDNSLAAADQTGAASLQPGAATAATGADGDPSGSLQAGAGTAATQAQTAGDGRFSIQLRTEPANARIELNGKQVGVGSLSRALSQDGSTHVLVISADNYHPRVISFADEFPHRVIRLERLQNDPAAGNRNATQRRRRRVNARGTANAAPPLPGKAAVSSPATSGGDQSPDSGNQAAGQGAQKTTASAEPANAASEDKAKSSRRRSKGRQDKDSRKSDTLTDNIDPWAD